MLLHPARNSALFRSIPLLFVLVASLVLVTSASATPSLFGSAYIGRDGASTLVSLNPFTGAATAIGLIGFERVSALAFDPKTGVLYGTGERSDGSDTSVLLSINTTTGAGTEIGPTGLESFTDGLRFGGGFDSSTDLTFRNSDNTLFSYTFDNDGLSTVDLTTGAMTEENSDTSLSTLGIRGYGLAFSATDTLYMADDIALYTLAPATGGVLTTLSLSYPATTTFGRLNALDFNPLNGILYGSLNVGFGASRASFLATVDLDTGLVSVVGPTGADGFGLDAIAFARVPEPGSMSLIGLGLAGLGWIARLRRPRV